MTANKGSDSDLIFLLGIIFADHSALPELQDRAPQPGAQSCAQCGAGSRAPAQGGTSKMAIGHQAFCYNEANLPDK